MWVASTRAERISLSGHCIRSRFILVEDPQAPVTLEARWKADAFDPANLLIFRNACPDGLNFLVAQDVDRPYARKFGPVKVRFIGLRHLPEALRAAPATD